VLGLAANRAPSVLDRAKYERWDQWTDQLLDASASGNGARQAIRADLRSASSTVAGLLRAQLLSASCSVCRTGQLRHLGKRRGLTLGLELGFADRFVLVRV
jgi:hypothetical protein